MEGPPEAPPLSSVPEPVQRLSRSMSVVERGTKQTVAPAHCGRAVGVREGSADTK
jgi:hypothetical protein